MAGARLYRNWANKKLPLPSTGKLVTVTATFASAPVSPQARFPDLKYNLDKVFAFTKDDGSRGDINAVAAVLWGGTGSDGTVYPGRTYSDGAGKQVPCGATLAINGGGTTHEGNPTYATWDQYNALNANPAAKRGNCFSNHSLNHDDQPSATESLRLNAAVFRQKLGVEARVVTVPGGLGGFVQAAKNLNAVYLDNYLLVSSEGFGGQGNPNADGLGNQVNGNDQLPIPVQFDPLFQLSTRANFDDKSQQGEVGWGWNDLAIPKIKEWTDNKFQRAGKGVYCCFAHGPADGEAHAFQNMIDYWLAHAGYGGRVGIQNLQEVAEWNELKVKGLLSAPTISGNTVTWTVDLSALPPYSRYQDVSLLLTGGTLQSVTVAGADDFSFNASTGLVNAYKLNPAPALTAPGSVSLADPDPFLATWDTGTRVSGKIPYSAALDSYFQDTLHFQDFGPLSDGTTAPYYGGTPPNQIPGPHQIYIDLRKYRAKVSKLRVFSRFAYDPTPFYYVEKGTFNRVLLGNMPPNAGWVELPLPTTKDVTWISFDSPDYPSELEIHGSYVAPTPFAKAVRKPKLRQLLGINMFESNVLQPDTPAQVMPAKLDLLDGFDYLRHYLDWNHIEPQKGRYMFNPSDENSGSWNYDADFAALKARGKHFRVCLKTMPNWMIATWPSTQADRENGLQDVENLPIEWQGSLTATIAASFLPASYKPKGQAWFQFCARHGKTVVADNLLNVFQTPNNVFPGNSKKTAQGVVDAVEHDNERDSFWKGPRGFSACRQQTASMSACYDGHKNTLGPGVGIKNADPTMNVSLGGEAIAIADTLHGIVDASRQMRGYKPDGSVDVPFDCINVHLYCNDGGSQQYNAASMRGMAPETGGFAEALQKIIDFADEYLGGMPVIVGEFGYDTSSLSAQAAIRPIDIATDANGQYQTVVLSDNTTRYVVKTPNDNTTRKRVQADWMARSVLELFRIGIAEGQAYNLENVVGASQSDKYGFSGFVDGFTRFPVANFYYQLLHLVGDYTLTNVLSMSPRVLQLAGPSGETAYAAWSPTETGATASYTFSNLPAGYTQQTLSYNALLPTSENLAAGSHTLTLTETPTFLVSPAAGSYSGSTYSGSTYSS